MQSLHLWEINSDKRKKYFASFKNFRNLKIDPDIHIDDINNYKK